MSYIDRIKEIKDYFLFGEWHHVHWIHSSFVHGLTLGIKKELGNGLSQAIFEQDGHIFRLYMSRSEWSNLGKEYLKEILDNPEKLDEVLLRIRQISDELIEFSYNISKKKIDNLSNKEIINILNNYHKLHHDLWSLGMTPNTLVMQQSVFTDYLKDYLKQKKLKDEDLLNVFQALSIPRENSITQKQGVDLFKLAKEGNRKGLKQHHEKYKWLTFGWVGPNTEYSFFENQFNDLVNNKESLKKLEDSLRKDNKLLREKDEYIKKLSITPECKKLFRLLEEILFLKAHRIDALYISYSALWPILKKISKDNHLSIKQVYGLRIPWLIEYLQADRFDIDKINGILKHSVEYYNGVNTKFYTGSKAEDIISAVKSSLIVEQKSKDLFIGECAWPGKVKGIVKIINQASEMGKLKEGEILVSNITDPSLLPAMKKASAFVTNSGGLTCHAAITARELKTPCVVGTKIASKILKDGDIVEIDAGKGYVKVLKKV